MTLRAVDAPSFLSQTFEEEQNHTFRILRVGVVGILLEQERFEELGEGAVVREQLVVGADLRDLPVRDDGDAVDERQPLHAVRHQKPRLKHVDQGHKRVLLC